VFRLLRNLFGDLLIWSSGTWVGSPDDREIDSRPPDNDSVDSGAADNDAGVSTNASTASGADG